VIDGQLSLTASALDQLSGARAELVSDDSERDVKLAVTQHLEELRALLDHTALTEIIDIDGRTRLDLCELTYVNDRVLNAITADEPTLGETPGEGHLPTLKAALRLTFALTRLLTLVAYARGLTKTRGLATPDSLLLAD
jgi:hypothetical protein